MTLTLNVVNVSCRMPADSDEWPQYTVKDKKYISLSPALSIQENMLPEKMAFWNTFVPTLAKPEPMMMPVQPPTTPLTPTTLAPTRQKEAIADKGKILSCGLHHLIGALQHGMLGRGLSKLWFHTKAENITVLCRIVGRFFVLLKRF